MFLLSALSPTEWVLVFAASATVIGSIAPRRLWEKRIAAQRTQFGGPEPVRPIVVDGNRRYMESELGQGPERVEKFHPRSLTSREQQRFAQSWRKVQDQFIDAPAEAVRDADRLLAEVMVARGYPVSAVGPLSADISQDDQSFIEKYRAVHIIVVRQRMGKVSTEDLRQAIVHCRNLIKSLTQEQEEMVRQETCVLTHR